MEDLSYLKHFACAFNTNNKLFKGTILLLL